MHSARSAVKNRNTRRHARSEEVEELWGRVIRLAACPCGRLERRWLPMSIWWGDEIRWPTGKGRARGCYTALFFREAHAVTTSLTPAPAHCMISEQIVHGRSPDRLSTSCFLVNLVFHSLSFVPPSFPPGGISGNMVCPLHPRRREKLNRLEVQLMPPVWNSRVHRCDVCHISVRPLLRSKSSSHHIGSPLDHPLPTRFDTWLAD